MATTSIETTAPQTPRKTQDKSAAQLLLREWMDDESGYDEATWPELKRALDSRHGNAKSNA